MSAMKAMQAMKAMKAMKALHVPADGDEGDGEPAKAMKAMKAVKPVKAMKAMKTGKPDKAPKESKDAKMSRLVSSLRDSNVARDRAADAAKSSANDDDDDDDDDDDADDDDEQGSAMKRPAAASISGGYEAKGWRNRSKQKAFDKLKKAGDLPPDVALFMQSHGRAEKTELVNKCIKKTADGCYELALDHPMMKRVRTAYEGKQSRDRTVTMPRIKAETGWGGGDNLDRAIAADQAWDNGDGTVGWKEGADDEVKGSSKQYVLEDTKKLDKKSLKLVEDIMAKMGWRSARRVFPVAKNPNIVIYAGENLPTAVKEAMDEV